MLFLFFAFLAGLATIAGPCILPLLPIVLGASARRAHPSRPLFIVLGFVMSFSSLSLALNVVGASLHISPETFRRIAIGIIAFFGVCLLIPAIQRYLIGLIQPLITKLTPHTSLEEGGLVSGFILGASLGLVWTPCAGPILGSILTIVATRRQLLQAGALLLAYACGAGLPMLAIAYGGQVVATRVRWLTRYAEIMQRVFGLLILLVALGLASGLDRDVQTYLVNQAPWLFPNLHLNL